MSKAIASRPWSTGTTFYVASKPGDDGVDWGYHTDPAKALPLSPYCQRSFAADSRRLGEPARFIPVNGEEQP